MRQDGNASRSKGIAERSTFQRLRRSACQCIGANVTIEVTIDGLASTHTPPVRLAMQSYRAVLLAEIVIVELLKKLRHPLHVEPQRW